MPTIASPLATTQPFIPALQQAEIGKFAGLHMHFPTLTALNAAVVAERGNISASSPMWGQGQVFSVATEPAGIHRVWDATAGHARTVILRPGLQVLLGTDACTVSTTSGAPSSGSGANGDIAIDFDANSYHTKASGAWTLTSANVYSGGAAGLTSLAFPSDGNLSLASTGGIEYGLKVMSGAITISPVGAILNGNCNFTLQAGSGVADLSAWNLRGDTPDFNTPGQLMDFAAVQRTIGSKPYLNCLLGDIVSSTAPTFGSPHIETGAPSTIVLPVSPSIGSTIPAAGDVTLGNGGGRTVTGVTKSGTNLLIALSAAAVYGSAFTVTIGVGKVSSAAGTLNAAGISAAAVTNNIAQPVPGAPTLTAGTPTATTLPVVVTAPTVDGSHGAVLDYVYEYKLATDSTYSVYADGTSTGTTAAYPSLTANTSYNLRAKATNASGAGPYSNVLTISTATSAPVGFFTAMTGTDGDPIPAPWVTNGTDPGMEIRNNAMHAPHATGYFYSKAPTGIAGNKRYEYDHVKAANQAKLHYLTLMAGTSGDEVSIFGQPQNTTSGSETMSWRLTSKIAGVDTALHDLNNTSNPGGLGLDAHLIVDHVGTTVTVTITSGGTTIVGPVTFTDMPASTVAGNGNIAAAMYDDYPWDFGGDRRTEGWKNIHVTAL